MSARLSRPSVAHGIGAAIVLALCGGAAWAALSAVIGTPSAARAVVALLGLVYVLYLFARSSERVGRLTTVAVWLFAAAALWLASVPFTVYVIVHVTLLCVVRSLYGYSRLLPALLDLALGALGIAFAAWAAARTGSPAAAIWCFFLTQAFHVLLPGVLDERAQRPRSRHESQFDKAHRAAEAALRRLSEGA